MTLTEKRPFTATTLAACLLLGGFSDAPAQSTYSLNAGGHIHVGAASAPASYDAGYTFYSAVWPLVGDYPRDNFFQSGLYGTWMFPDDGIDNIAPYTNIEGGLGWWYDRQFQTATPKFITGGVAFGGVGGTIAPMYQWIFANGPGGGSANGNGKYGVAQLSPSLLFPPDGLNLKQGTSGELFGYGYLPLPLTQPKATTAGHPVPTGNQSWTLFLNTRNFKGPLAFFTPFFWSQIKITYPELADSLLDSCGSGPDKFVAMETPHSIRVWGSDTPDGRFARSMPVYFPVDPNGYSLLMHRLSVYDRTALWNEVAAWFAGTGPAASGNPTPSGTFLQSASGSNPVWSIRGSTELGRLDWTRLAAPVAANPQDMGYQWQINQMEVVPWGNASLVRLPEYYQGPLAATSSSLWSPIAEHDVPPPAAAALAARNFNNPFTRSPVVAKDNDPAWTTPGPVRGPFRALLGDGSVVTYYWYRFADQPALQKADLTPAEREQMQVLAEKIHREWKHDRDYIEPPTSGTLADLDPGQLVTPPLGMEVGYVPIAWQQDWGGSVANPGALGFTTVPDNPVTGQPFSVTLRAETSAGAAQNVTSPTLVQLSVASGNGLLDGTTSATIPTGQSSVTISGVTYSAAESMTLQASATCLSPGTSPDLAFSNPSGQIHLFSRPASDISIDQAMLHATLGCPGTDATVTLFWGTSNEGNRADAWENPVSLGSWNDAGATEISHSATGLQPKTTYYYIFRATGSSGTVWSAPVKSFKTLPPIPVITAHPADSSRVAGSTAGFTVAASDAASYQWYHNGTPLADGGGISGAASATLQLTRISPGDAGSYHVVVGNGSGNVASNPASLAVVPVRTLTWDANPASANAQDGGGDWLGGNHWLDGATNLPWNDNHNAVIGSGGTGGTINPGMVVVNNLTFNNFSGGSYTIGSGSLAVAGELLYQSNRNTKITAVLSGTGRLTKNGSGSLTLDGVTGNTYSGGTTVHAGTLVLGTIVSGISPVCSLAAGSGPVTLHSGARIHLHRVVPNNPLILNGGTLRVVNGWGATWAGPITVNQDTTLEADWTFPMELLGNISGAGGFTKTGTYTLTFAGRNSHTGTTTVQAGKVVYRRAASVAPGRLSINSGASVELAYNGTGQVSSLNLNGVAQVAGTYGSSASPATFQNDSYFSGPGTITVTNMLIQAGPDRTLVFSGLMGDWTPAEITPQLWLDAADDATLTLNGAAVSQWADKSGFNRHATQTNAANQPAATPNALHGRRVLTFDGSNDFFSVNLDFLAGQSHSAFIVTKPTAFSNIYGAANASAGSRSLHVGFTNATNYRINFWANDYQPPITGNFVAGKANLLNFIWIPGTGKQILANGRSEGTHNNAGNIGTMAGGGRIGRTTTASHAAFGGQIAEIIMITGDIGTHGRQNTEGYLAHKWGLAANLPADHPSRNAPPKILQAVTHLAGSASSTLGQPVVSAWSLVSGPASVTLGNPDSLETSAEFTVPGTYVLRLTASDGSSEAWDDVLVIVNHACSVTFDGNGHTSGSPPASQTKWHSADLLIAGNNGNLAKTHHDFAGWNTRADGDGADFAAGATYTANEPLTLYAKWLPIPPYEAWAGPDAPFDGDANGDGVTNGLAFLLGAASPDHDALGLIPSARESSGGLVMSFRMLDASARGTAQLMLEYSNRLAPGSWTTVPVPNSTSTVDDVLFTITGTGPLNVSATIPADKADGGRLFGRLTGKPQ